MKKLLYVFDDINYLSGARKVTEYQIKLLSTKYDISIFSLKKPSFYIEEQLSMVQFFDELIWDNTEVFALSLLEVLKLKKTSFKQKFIRIIYSICMRLNIDHLFMNRYVFRFVKERFNSFDIVCVVSESSKLRSLVASLSNPKKIQWIHTDYLHWSEFSNWTKIITSRDEKLYNNFDTIITLSEKNMQGFINKIPSLKGKTIVIRNLIPIEEIIQKSKEPLKVKMDKKITNIVTVGRIDKEKAFDRVLNICKMLKKDGLQYHWYIVGDGPLIQQVKQTINEENLIDEVSVLGKLDNPYPLMKECDIFALLSEYEGTPVTIEEAMVLGTPVVATDVGGIKEQLCGIHNGILVENEETAIYNQLKIILKKEYLHSNGEEVTKKYFYDNSVILDKLIECFES